ncbi:respiratory chain complex I subunit 1 family protein [Christensenella timonensis]|uniref:respiratory chain complex I subunit 1 family protein n=1 Tax=Christensenella timonensis TaxID=1816678 RepID=UPI00083519E9|nr:complex I subunit 1 family protein [Christensenella timonensis]
MNWQVVTMLLYIILAPFLGAFLQGADRKITARMQGRQGPPLMQPIYDVAKLFKKQALVVNRVQDFLVVGFLLFVVFTGALFFWGGDLLLVFFALTLAEIFFIMSACSTNSPFSAMAAQRELLQVMTYEPMVLLVAIGFYVATGSFGVSTIAAGDTPAIMYLPGIFGGFLYILTIKFRKSPFDLSTSHHAHQEMVKGITTELSGNILGLVEIAHWYENIFLLGVVGLFVVYSPWQSVLIAVGVCAVAYFLEILVDNVFPRVKWQSMLKSAWLVTLVAGCTNLLILALVK